jgi:hypothetical protein
MGAPVGRDRCRAAFRIEAETNVSLCLVTDKNKKLSVTAKAWKSGCSVSPAQPDEACPETAGRHIDVSSRNADDRIRRAIAQVVTHPGLRPMPASASSIAFNET